MINENDKKTSRLASYSWDGQLQQLLLNLLALC